MFWGSLQKEATSYIKQIQEATSLKNSCMATYHPSQRPSKLDEHA